MPWRVTIVFADPRERVAERVPGDAGLSMAIEAVLHKHGLRMTRPYDLVNGGERSDGYQITVTPCV